MNIDDFDALLTPGPGEFFMDTDFVEEKFDLWLTLLRTQCCSTHEAIDTVARLTFEGTKEEFQQPNYKDDDWEETAKRRMTMLLMRMREVSA